jgi:LysM repeat protein
VIEETSTPLGSGPAACPFVAFEDDRDHRSSAPDYRHRCFASAEPEPRAFPHQERYCLSPEFSLCPVFLDWARQEAAGVAAGAPAVEVTTETQPDEAPAFLSRRGRPEPVLPAGSSRRTAAGAANLWSYEGETSRAPAPTAPPAPSSLAQPAVAMARRGPTHPGWENPPRLESFPRLRARDDRRANQPLLAAAMAVAVLFVALVTIPLILSGSRGGSGNNPSPSVGGSAGPTASSIPTAVPGPTFLRYRVQKGDNFSSIASKYNLLSWELQLANPQIENYNILFEGQILLIPPPGFLTMPPATPAGT